MRLPTVARLFLAALKGWSKDNVPRLGASLAYATLFSIAPVLLIAIAIAGWFFGADAVRGEIARQLDGLVGQAGAEAVQALLKGASRPDRSRLAAILGGVTFLIASTGAFMELQHALNTVFKVKAAPIRNSKIKEFLWDRLRSFSIVLSIGFVLLVSLVASAALAALSSWAGNRWLIGSPILWQAVNVVFSLALITVLFALIYRFLPDARMHWGDVWIGSAITSALFILGKELIGLYLGRSSVASTYGAAASVVVLLLWVYYASQIILLGAEMTRVIARHRGHELEPLAIAERDPKSRPSEMPVSPPATPSRGDAGP